MNGSQSSEKHKVAAEFDARKSAAEMLRLFETVQATKKIAIR